MKKILMILSLGLIFLVGCAECEEKNGMCCKGEFCNDAHVNCELGYDAIFLGCDDQCIPKMNCVKTENCAKEGEIAFDNSIGKHKDCCSGLTEVVNLPKPDFQGKCMDDCEGCGTICLNCGSGICENKENKCNCPEDCS